MPASCQYKTSGGKRTLSPAKTKAYLLFALVGFARAAQHVS